MFLSLKLDLITKWCLPCSVTTMFKDVLYALRTLRSQPGFVLVAVCSLAIGIGANSAIYSFADALLLRPLPISKPNEVVDVTPITQDVLGTSTAISYPDFKDLREHNHTFEDLVASALVPFGFAPDKNTQPRMRMSLFVSGNFFETLGVKAKLGRGFLPDEDREGNNQEVVLSHEIWASDLDSDPHVVGRDVLLNGLHFTVVGVAPESFSGIGQVKPAMYVPLTVAAKVWEPAQVTDRSRRWVEVRGRLKPGIGLNQANADVAAVVSALRHDYPATDQSLTLAVKTELKARFDEQPPNVALVLILALLAVCVLLVACGNVAGLLAARGAGRVREMAVRMAMGASRSSLIKQLLLEDLLLAFAGGLAGLVIALTATHFFNTLPLPTDVPINMHFQLDQRALLFTFLVALCSVLLFGLAPAWRGTKLDLNSALKEKAGTSSRSARFWGRTVIVCAQVALSCILLVVSAALVNGFRSELARGPGYRITGLQLMSFDGSLVHYSGEQMTRFYKDLRERARALPGVKAVTLCSSVPLSVTGGDSVSIVPEGHQLARGENALPVMRNIVTPEYFSVMNVPLIAGRSFDETDTDRSPAVVIVNEQFAHHYWPNQSAIGKRIRLDSATGTEARVVGVAKTTKYLWVSEAPYDFLYQPFAQANHSNMSLIAQSAAGDPTNLVPELRQMVHSLDRDMPIFDVRTMASLYRDRAVVTPRYIIKTVAALGILALILACIGLYGIVSYVVGRRSREFGVRMAVGATQSRIARMVLGNALKLGLTGTAIGMVVGWFTVQAVRSTILFSFRQTANDVYLFVLLLLFATIAMAGYIPARRASRVDPMRALREE